MFCFRCVLWYLFYVCIVVKSQITLQQISMKGAKWQEWKIAIATSCWHTIANKGEWILSSSEATVLNCTPASQRLVMPNRSVMWATHVVLNAAASLQRSKEREEINTECLYVFYLLCYTIKIIHIVLWQDVGFPTLVQSSVFKWCQFSKS